MKRSHNTRTALITLYFIIGLLFAIVIKYGIPEVNIFGMSYYCVTWPAWLVQSVTHSYFMPNPPWGYDA